jgi:excisionase family DNA binding protein
MYAVRYVLEMQYAYYTAKQVAELAGCPKITVTKRLERGKLPSFRLGKYGRERTGKHIILAEDAARFISEYRIYRTLRESNKLNP